MKITPQDKSPISAKQLDLQNARQISNDTDDKARLFRQALKKRQDRDGNRDRDKNKKMAKKSMDKPQTSKSKNLPKGLPKERAKELPKERAKGDGFITRNAQKSPSSRDRQDPISKKTLGENKPKSEKKALNPKSNLKADERDNRTKTFSQNDDKKSKKDKDYPSSPQIREGDQPTNPSLMQSAIQAEQASSSQDLALTAKAPSQQDMIALVQKASQRVLIAKGDGAQNVKMRIDLRDELLPQTSLSVEKQSDGALKMIFTTQNAQSANMIGQMQQGLAQHLKQTQNISAQIILQNQNGEPIKSSPNRDSDENQQNPKNQPNQTNWDIVSDRLKEAK